MDTSNIIVLNQSAHCGNMISNAILGQKFLKNHKGPEGEAFCEDPVSYELVGMEGEVFTNGKSLLTSK